MKTENKTTIALILLALIIILGLPSCKKSDTRLTTLTVEKIEEPRLLISKAIRKIWKQ